MLHYRNPPQLRSCFWIGRYPNMLNRRKRKYPPSRSKAKSISFQIRMRHILCNKKKMSKNTTKLQYQTNDLSYSLNTKNYKENSFIIFCLLFMLLFYYNNYWVLIFVVLYNRHWDYKNFNKWSEIVFLPINLILTRSFLNQWA